MTTPAQGNLSGSSAKQPDGGFEASGISPEEAERLAAAFKPSWEFDEAPFAQANGALDPSEIDALAREPESARPPTSDSRIVPPHAPPHRVETHEPEVSVIIDRSITAAEMDALRSPHTVPSRPVAVPPPASFAAPAFPPPAVAAPSAPARVAPVMRAPRSADDSLELPASLKKSNRGLFIGLGVAVAGAVLVLVVHGATSSSSDSASAATAAPTATAASTAAEIAQRSPVPIPPPPIATTPPAPTPVAPPAVVAPTPPTVPAAAAAPAPQRSAPVVAAAPKPPVPPHAVVAPAVHHAAPKPPPKAAAGGIVRDNPF